MRAAILTLARPQYDDDDGVGLLGERLPASSTPSARRFPSFRDRDFSFVDLRPAHLDLFRAVYGTNVPTIDEVIGKAMVDTNYIPLGAVMVYFEPDRFDAEYGQRIYVGRQYLYAHFGPWLKIYPSNILRAMHEVANDIR